MPAGLAPASDDQTPPMGAPMTTPEPQYGTKEGALISVGIALDLLEQSLAALPSDGDEADNIMKAVRALSKVLGGKRQRSSELQSSEILQMIATLPQAGGATPEMKSLAAAPVPGMPAKQQPPGLPH